MKVTRLDDFRYDSGFKTKPRAKHRDNLDKQVVKITAKQALRLDSSKLKDSSKEILKIMMTEGGVYFKSYDKSRAYLTSYISKIRFVGVEIEPIKGEDNRVCGYRLAGQ